MRDRNLLGPWVRRFLLEYLVAERNLARNTQVSYRDTLTLLVPFVGLKAGAAIDRLSVEDISPDTVRGFLEHVEHDSLDTTHIYAEVDLEMKAKALASVDITDLPAAARPRLPSPSLMEFMRRL